MGFIGPPFLEMLIIFPPLVSSVKEWEGPLHIGMRCPNNPLSFVRFFMFGGIDFLGSFRVSHGFSYILLLVMFLGGLKLRPPELMILKLLWIF